MISIVAYVGLCILTMVWACDSDTQDAKIEFIEHHVSNLEDEIDFLQEQLDELYDKVFALENLTNVLHAGEVE